LHRRPNPGFTLPDVLVAILVLSVGILSAAAAQVASLRTRHGSALLSNGVQLASTLADRMRANSAQMRLPDARNPYLQLAYDAAAGAPPATGACFAAQACGSEQLATFDIGETMQALHQGFPGGRVRVCRDGAASMDWDCSGGAQAPIVIKIGWLRRQADGSWHATPALVMVAGGAP
jgi:type IV pilus assembly protein PilV